MYSEWGSLQQEIQADGNNCSVLQQYPETVGKDVAVTVVKTLAQSISSGAGNGEFSALKSDSEVKWTMEVVCYGLSLPLVDIDTIRDCINVYCEWLSATLKEPRKCVPRPIREDPNAYARVMLSHLYNAFVPRSDTGTSIMANPGSSKTAAGNHTDFKLGSSSSLSDWFGNSSALSTGSDLIHKQAVHCHRALRTVQNMAENSQMLTRQTWDSLLKFFLRVCDALLAPPTIKDSIGDQLCQRVLSALFEVWILACTKSFPSPPLWKTFRDMCGGWRHHEALVSQWHRVNVSFTARIIKIMNGPNYPELSVPEEDQNLIPETMDNDCVAQCWFRLLHTIGSPVDLSRPQVIGNTPKFLHMALTSETVQDPHKHECLYVLPKIFHRAMKSVSVLVDAFLGISQGSYIDIEGLVPVSGMRHSTSSLQSTGATPPSQRRPKTTGSGLTSKGAKTSVLSPQRGSSITSIPPSALGVLTLDSCLALAPNRPSVNSILHLFGSWLVESAIVGVKVHGSSSRATLSHRVSVNLSQSPFVVKPKKVLSRSRTASFHLDPGPSRHHSQSDPSPDEHELKGSYAAGRAEACGTLCRIYCSHKTKEEILNTYLSRFYIVVYYGLQTGPNLNGQVLANIVFNGTNLLRVDLKGVMILVPQILQASELILSDLEPKFRYDELIPPVELRKASIHLLLSMICLPLHFKTLTIKHIFGEQNQPDPPVTFISLKMKIIELLLRALTVENDANNTQMLLGGLALCVLDLAICEEAEKTMQQEERDGGPPPSPSSLSEASTGRKVKKASPVITITNAPETVYVTGLQKPSSQNSDFDSAHGLFGHAASLVCNRLMASWKMDLNIALAAIEVLSGLAKVHLNKPNALMCKRTVNWICEFIVYQCSRPAPLHSKDLHSMIVAAFHCLTLWLVEHDFLMQDKECLQGVLEVVELGISGTKSQQEVTPNTSHDTIETAGSIKGEKGKSKDKSRESKEEERNKMLMFSDPSIQNRASDIPKLKGDKDPKPVSLRVREAAEGLLTAIMDQVGSFPPPCGPESICSLLDEDALLKYCKEGGLPEQGTPFRYFVLEGNTVLGLFEQPLGNDQDPLPTVTAIIRGPFGRHAWTMQLRNLPRHKKASSRAHLVEATRPEPKNNVGKSYDVQHRCFPEMVEQIPPVEADKSIPKLESLQMDDAGELEKLQGFIDAQVAFENKVMERVQKEMAEAPFPNPETECKPPEVCHDFQTARLFLSHYGFLTLEALKDPPNSSIPPSLVMLDTSEADFIHDLEQLDAIPCRTADTVHVFYVKPGQKMPFEILSNVTCKNNVDPIFLEFLCSLGWPVDVKKHAGWTGHTSTSWKIQPADEDEEFLGETGGSLYDGQQQVLYWADVSAEVAFVVPSPETYHTAGRRSSTGTSVSPPPLSPVSAVARGATPRHRASLPAISLTALPGKAGAPGRSHKTLAKLAEGDGEEIENTGKSPTSSTSSSEMTGKGMLTTKHMESAVKPKSLSLDLEKLPSEGKGSPLVTPTEPFQRMRRFGRSGHSSNIPETKVFVVWLESYEDYENFPVHEMMVSSSTGLEPSTSSSNIIRQTEPPVFVIFIHPLANGLFRVHLQGTLIRMSMAIPLVDGMVVSRRTLGTIVRQTAINICRRKRLENDTYQPPHVRRKFKIKEMAEKYRSRMIEPSFYTALFQDANKQC